MCYSSKIYSNKLAVIFVLILALNIQCQQFSQPFEIIEIKPEHLGKLKLFLLVGQSNMSGRGDLSEFRNDIDSNIYLFGNDYKWHYAQEPSDNEYNQVDDCSIDKNPGVSPAFSFAKALLQFDSTMIIGLIPCAKGGSSIAEWQKDFSDNGLYISMIERAKVTSQYGEIAGILFYQGERDANADFIDSNKNRFGLPESWAEYFTEFVSNVRNDLGNQHLPIFVASLGVTPDIDKYAYWEIIKTEQRNIEIPNVYFIQTDDLEPGQSVHFQTSGYITIGERYADAYLQYLEETK